MTPGSAGRWGVGRSKRKGTGGCRGAGRVGGIRRGRRSPGPRRARTQPPDPGRPDRRGARPPGRARQPRPGTRLTHSNASVRPSIISSEAIDARAGGAPRARRVGRQAHAGVATARADVDAIAPRILPRERLVGGTVFGATDPVVTVDIDLVAEERRAEAEAEAERRTTRTAPRPDRPTTSKCSAASKASGSTASRCSRSSRTAACAATASAASPTVS